MSRLIYVGAGIVIGIAVLALAVRSVIRDAIGRGLKW